MIDGGTFLFVIGVAALLAAALTIAWALVSWIADQLAFRQYADDYAADLLDPDGIRRYVGCIECEAAEELGRMYLIRHQSRDHATGVRTW